MSSSSSHPPPSTLPSFSTSLPSDVSVAFDYLLHTFPFSPPTPGFLEPRVLLVSQLYALIADRTAVDIDLVRRRQEGSIVVQRVAALGVDEYALITTDEYRQVVHSIIERKAQRVDAMRGKTREAEASAPPPASLFASPSRPIKRKRKPDGGAATVVQAEVASTSRADPSASLPSAPASSPMSISASSTATRPPPLSPVSSPSQNQPLPLPSPLLPGLTALIASSSPSDKENLSRDPSPSPPPPPLPFSSVDFDRLVDEVTVLRLVLSDLLPHLHALTVTRARLLSSLYTPHTYRQLTAEGVIAVLFHHQLLVSGPPTTGGTKEELFWVGLPHAAGLWREVLDVRVELRRMVSKTRFGEMRRSEMERRVRVKDSERGIRWHMLEMIGRGSLELVDTTKGTMVRLAKEETRRR